MRTFISTLLILTFLSSCQDENYRVLPENGNYFPTTKGSRWTYEQKYPCEWPNEASTCSSTRESVAEGEELPWDDSFEPYVSATASFQFVKVSGSEYFGYGYYVLQYKFLDDNLPKGSQWIYGGADTDILKDVFEITEVNATKEVHGVSYPDVIVVKNTYMSRRNSDDFETVSTTSRWYAKGVGEIYMIHTRNDQGVMETFENLLTDYSIAQ